MYDKSHLVMMLSSGRLAAHTAQDAHVPVPLIDTGETQSETAIVHSVRTEVPSRNKPLCPFHETP